MLPAKVKSAYQGSLVLSEDPMVAVIDDVLSPYEVTYIIDCALGRVQRAKVSFDDGYGMIPGRSGGNYWLRYDSDPMVREVGERIAAIVGIPLSHAEALQVIHYGPEQEYRPHYDAYDLSTPRGQRCCRRGGQRLVTGLVYLNEVDQGGETAFPNLGVSIAPRPGRLAIFHDTGVDITVPHPDSLHAGTPVKRGEKWAFNIWFHARPMKDVQQFDSVPADRVESKPAGTGRSSRRGGAVDGKPVDLIVNRAERLWQRACDNIESTLTDTGASACFSYWDTYGGSQPDLSGVDMNTRLVKLIDRKYANALANKRNLARLIRNAGLGHVAPATYERVDEALKDNPAGTIWFVKPVFRTAGEGMYCVPADALSELDLPSNSILQKEVDNPLLSGGSKFTTRIYILVWNGEIRLFETGITVTHGVPYQEASTDYQVQIDHRGYQDAASPVEIRPGFKNDAFIEHLPTQRILVRALRPILSDCAQASDRDRYIILGIDTLIRRDGTVRLIEINSYPNFIHTSEVNNEVNVPLFESVICTITGLSDPRLEIL